MKSGEIHRVLQTLTHHEAAVLCLEGIHSHFAASQHIFDSGIYEVVAATSIASAVATLRAIERIGAAVLEAEMAAQERLRAVAEINAVKPGLPKIVIAPPPNFPRPKY